MADFAVTVIGAGAVGLAVAARLAPTLGDALLILERHERHGTETSSRNSEVIHAGMYYPTGSDKATLCVEGNATVYQLCEVHDVPHRRCGKLISAVVPEELGALERLLARGRANGVELEMLSAAQVHAMEPAVASVGALWSPNTGIVSAHGLMDLFLHQALSAGALLQSRAELVGLERAGDDWRLAVRGDGQVETITSERVVNAAGLDADRVAQMAGIDIDEAGYRLHWCKGDYFSVMPARYGMCSRLVYPVPGQVSLGVHAVLGLDGRVRFGPDATYVERGSGYQVDPSKRATFAASIRRLFPDVQDEEIEPDMSGIRPKLQRAGEPFRDFVVADESARGLPGLVDLIGIESPGLTASPAIAQRVAGMLGVA